MYSEASFRAHSFGTEDCAQYSVPFAAHFKMDEKQRVKFLQNLLLRGRQPQIFDESLPSRLFF